MFLLKLSRAAHPDASRCSPLTSRLKHGCPQACWVSQWRVTTGNTGDDPCTKGKKRYFNSEFWGFQSSAAGHTVLKPLLRKGGSSVSWREHRQVTAFQLEARGRGHKIPFKTTLPTILRVPIRPYFSKSHHFPIAPWTKPLIQRPSGTVPDPNCGTTQGESLASHIR